MNNKGFAITTILYGMLILFLMLLVSLLGILSTYRSRLEKLQEGENGARTIINSRYNDIVPNIILLKDTNTGKYKVVLSSGGFKNGTYTIKYGRVAEEVNSCLSLINTTTATVENGNRKIEIELPNVENTTDPPLYACIVDGISDIFGHTLQEEIITETN